MRRKGFFITLEGPDGCGKSTQSQALHDFLISKGIEAHRTREPGGTPLAEKLRKFLLDPSLRMSVWTELFLFETLRAHHVESLLQRLAEGCVVVCDRFTDSTLAYQGYGRKMDLKAVRLLNGLASRGLVPDLTLLLDVPVRTGLLRNKKIRSLKTQDRMEKEKITFHERVRRGYLSLAKQEPKRVRIIDASKPLPDVRFQVCREVWRILEEKHFHGFR